MSVREVKQFLNKELDKMSKKTSTDKSEQELLGKLLCNYEQVLRLDWMEQEAMSGKMSHNMSYNRSNHSMRDKEIAALEEKIDKAPSDYEREFYRKLIRAAQDYKD